MWQWVARVTSNNLSDILHTEQQSLFLPPPPLADIEYCQTIRNVEVGLVPRSSPFFFCSLVCVQYNTWKWKTGKAWEVKMGEAWEQGYVEVVQKAAECISIDWHTHTHT